jgi:hypothetical protein
MNKDLVNVSDIDIDEDKDNSMLQDNLNLSLNSYKKDLDNNVDRKKNIIKDLYLFKKVLNENELRAKLEIKHSEEANSLKAKYDSLKRKKMEEIRETYKKKLDEKTRSINDSNFEKQRKIDMDKEACGRIEREILGLKAKLDELRSGQDRGNNKYEDEVKRIENEYNSNLKQLQNGLESEFKIKKEKLKAFYNNKKIEYENSLKQDRPKGSISNEDIIKEKKEDMLKAHKDRLESFKSSIKSQIIRSKDKDRDELTKTHALCLEKLRENFLTAASNLEQQKHIFTTEQGLIFINNLISKIKSISESKNSVFKNLLDFNQFTIKKKLKDIEGNKDFLTFTNREAVLAKIIDLLSTISYDSIYEYLTSELNTDKEIVSAENESLTQNFEKVFSGFSRKVELTLNALSPNFSF